MTEKQYLLAELLPGCPSYKEFANAPYEINGTCYATNMCTVGAIIKYLCDVPISTIDYYPTGEASCTTNYTWQHFPSTETCVPASE